MNHVVVLLVGLTFGFIRGVINFSVPSLQPYLPSKNLNRLKGEDHSVFLVVDIISVAILVYSYRQVEQEDCELDAHHGAESKTGGNEWPCQFHLLLCYMKVLLTNQSEKIVEFRSSVHDFYTDFVKLEYSSGSRSHICFVERAFVLTFSLRPFLLVPFVPVSCASLQKHFCRRKLRAALSKRSIR